MTTEPTHISHPDAEVPRGACGGLGYLVHRYGPDDNVEQIQCWCADCMDSAADAHVEDLWSEGPMTPLEQDSWDAIPDEHDARAVMRMRRFCAVRGAPKQPATEPTLWAAMLRHDRWRAWLGLLPVEPFTGALTCDENQP